MLKVLAVLAVVLLAVIAAALSAPYAEALLHPVPPTAVVYHGPRYDAPKCAEATERRRQAEHDQALAPTANGVGLAARVRQQAQNDMDTYC